MSTEKKRKKSRRSGGSTAITSYAISIGILSFVGMSGILFQHTEITEKNQEIRQLQSTLDSEIQANDSKEGQLVTNMNLQGIEAQARSYGMLEPVQEQYRREWVTPKVEEDAMTNMEMIKNWLSQVLELGFF